MRGKVWWHLIGALGAFVLMLAIWGLSPLEAKGQSRRLTSEAPKFEVDPFWPKPLPDGRVLTVPGGVCVDARDHIISVNRGSLDVHQLKTVTAVPPVTEFDSDGNLVNSWGNRDVLPGRLHSCFVDYQGNVWIGGSQDGIVQKYTHDGSKMLLQIGTKGQFDTSDGTMTGAPMNSSHTLLNLPSSIVVDPSNGDVYIADGYGNRRVVVFDSSGHFLRQWGRQGTLAESAEGVPGTFLQVVHCAAMSNDGFIYVCDREGQRVEVFDKMGKFVKNIPVQDKNVAKGVLLACWVNFSADPAQKFMYVGGCTTGKIFILDRLTGEVLSILGQAGTQAGENFVVHTMTVDSKGNIYVADSLGRRLQKYRLVR